jgi:hypothetical protein
MLREAYASNHRDSAATRTRDPQLRRLLLYPTELRNRSTVKKTAANIIIFSFVNYLSLWPAASGRLHPVDQSLLFNYLFKLRWQGLEGELRGADQQRPFIEVDLNWVAGFVSLNSLTVYDERQTLVD